MVRRLAATEPERLGREPGKFETQEAATAAAQSSAKRYKHNGYHRQQRYWWGRNDGEETHIFMTVTVSD
jgi:hypothetical protein